MKLPSTIACIVFLSGGCAAAAKNSGTTPVSPKAAPAALDQGEFAQLQQRYEAQQQRLGELEARVALLESEARAARQAPVRSTETVRIGKQRRARSRDEDDQGVAEPDATSLPVIKLYEEGRPAMAERFEPPPAPPGVATTLAVVPLPGARTQEALAAADGVAQRHARADYRTALGMLREQRYPEALAAFERFSERYPGHALSDNAVYWQGEVHYAERRYEAALSAFQTVLSSFPDSNKAADALLKAGMCHRRLGNAKEAARFFSRVRAEYPNSEAAHAAPPEGSS